MIRSIVADKTTSVFAAQAACAALFARERSGQGQSIRLSMVFRIHRSANPTAPNPGACRRPKNPQR